MIRELRDDSCSHQTLNTNSREIESLKLKIKQLDRNV